MLTILLMGILWAAYGVAGLLGHQVVPKMYQGKVWTGDYIRDKGKMWLMIGVSWVALYFAGTAAQLPRTVMLVALGVLTLPQCVLTLRLENKYEAMLNEK
jgi:hypothetical protein